MRFGIGPMGCRRPPGDETSFSTIYEAEVGLAELAEEAGFDSAWVAEHHFADDGYLPSPFTVAGAIASRTEAMEVGTGIALAPFYEPVRLAENAAAVDLLAAAGGGRCTLGLGIGYRDVEFEAFGVPMEERVPRLLDAVETCRGAWSDGPFSLDGRAFSYPEVNVTPKPESDLPLVVGAFSEPGIERAARIADGFALASPDLETVDDRLGILHEALLDEDRDPAEFETYVLQYAFVHADGRDAAWEAIRDGYLYTRKTYLEYFSNSADSDLDLTDEDIEEQAAELEDRWRSNVIHGSPEEVTERLEAYADRYGEELHMVLGLHYPGMDYEPAREAVELFGDEVIPELEGV